MTNTPQYQANTWEVPAGGFLEVARSADFLVCLEASSPFKIAFDQSPETNFEAGLSFHVPMGFHRIRLRNPNAGAISVRLGFGRGDLRDARLVLEGSIQTAPQSPEQFEANGPVTIAAGAAVQLAGADLSRREIAVKNLNSSETIWIKGEGVAGASGWPLAPFEGAVLTTTAAVFAYNPAAGSVDVATFETKEG